MTPPAHVVLMADDDPLVHRLCQPHVERAGFQMVSAANGREALDLVAAVMPTVIVLDIIMPEMDGLSVLRELRKNESTRNIPVIVVTSAVASHAAYRKEASNCGATVFLTKPFSPAQLLAELKRLV